MHNHTYGEIFERNAPRRERPSRSTTRLRTSYNEDLIAPTIDNEHDDGDAHPSSFPCTNFVHNAGILEDFLFLVGRVGLTNYMNDERNQYAMLTKIFVESFVFNNAHFGPTVSFKIYERPITLSLSDFCHVIGITSSGTAKKIQGRPADLLELYRGVTNDDDRTAQRGKIRNIQLPAIRYFAYYLATSVLGRENTSNISNYHLAFLDAALNGRTSYNLGALIARRLAARGPIYGGIIASRMLAHLGLSVDPSDALLAPHRLDLAAMKMHQFVTANSCEGNLVYRMLFTDGEESHIPLPQPALFDVRRRPWSRSKVEMDDQLRLLGFYGQGDQEGHEAHAEDHTVHYTGAASGSYQDREASSSYFGGASSWPRWD